ncbi:hypothetical protein F5Y16DRAFT_399654 [Xylariaceae sp. FL0255]|nr:hypothetical protein F5Y16DRAFT_399654 [Xylariaceae sp. FL0255]
MCRYRKSIFLCNHAQVSAEPLIVCEVQSQYLASSPFPIVEPCDITETHARNTIRVTTLCAECEKRNTNVEQRFLDVKKKMAELRVHLNEAYDHCMTHLDEAGLTAEEKEKESREEEKDEDDPIKAFLKKKMTEKHSHLMMLGSS